MTNWTHPHQNDIHTQQTEFRTTPYSSGALKYILPNCGLWLMHTYIKLIDTHIHELECKKKERMNWKNLEKYKCIQIDGGGRTWKFSKPKMSSTPMKRVFSVPGFVQELIWLTSHVKAREYSALAMACRFSHACHVGSTMSYVLIV